MALTCARAAIKTVSPGVVDNYSILVNCRRAPGNKHLKLFYAIFVCLFVANGEEADLSTTQNILFVQDRMFQYHGCPLSESLGVQEL